MADTKRSDAKYLDKINEIAGTFTSPFARDIFIELADRAYDAAKAKYGAVYVAKKVAAEEIPAFLDRDPEYGMHLTDAVAKAEKLVRKIETAIDASKTDTASLDKRLKDLKKREDALKKNEKTYELNLAGMEQREAMMKQVGDKYGNIAKYEMQLGEREIALKAKEAQFVDIKFKHEDLDARITMLAQREKALDEKAKEIETGKGILEQGYRDLDEREKALTAREERAKDLIPHAINAAKQEIHESLGEILTSLETHQAANGKNIEILRGFYNEYKPESLAQAPEIKADTSVRAAPQNNA